MLECIIQNIFTAYTGTIRNNIIYIVPYCSELNPIEMIFSKVMMVVNNKNTYENEIQLKRNVKIGFRLITKRDLKGYYTMCLSF